MEETKPDLFICGPDGRFKLLVDDPNVAGLPFIAFAGPVCEGVGQVTPELPKELQENDSMFMVAKFSGTTSESVAIPSGWTLVEFLAQPAMEATQTKAEYMCVFYKRAVSVESAPTLTHCDFTERILAQIVISRPHVGQD